MIVYDVIEVRRGSRGAVYSRLLCSVSSKSAARLAALQMYRVGSLAADYQVKERMVAR